jgi:hypothetical protein
LWNIYRILYVAPEEEIGCCKVRGKRWATDNAFHFLGNSSAQQVPGCKIKMPEADRILNKFIKISLTMFVIINS